MTLCLISRFTHLCLPGALANLLGGGANWDPALLHGVHVSSHQLIAGASLHIQAAHVAHAGVDAFSLAKTTRICLENIESDSLGCTTGLRATHLGRHSI